MITIDGEAFDVPILSMDESADFLDKFAERTEDGVLHRELIGVYFNQNIQFGSIVDPDEYARLWAKLTEAVEFHDVTVPDGDAAPISFVAYFSNVKRSLKKDTETNTYWKSMTVNFIAQEPYNTP